MMPHLDQIYDTSFFEEWGRHNQDYVNSASVVTETIYQQFKPHRLIDVGCGCGVYSHLFNEKGVDVVSIDGVLPPEKDRYPIEIHRQDLTVPFQNKWGEFDLTLCLEVAEHIPEELSGVFLKNITQFGKTLLLSAAPPNQGGHHHVNEQPKRYWVQRLAQEGFLYNRKRTGQFVEAFRQSTSPFKWIGEHISVYEKMEKGSVNRADLPFQVRAPQS